MLRALFIFLGVIVSIIFAGTSEKTKLVYDPNVSFSIFSLISEEEGRKIDLLLFQSINYKIRKTKVDCIDHNATVCSNLVCELKIVSRETEVLNLGCNVTQPYDDIFLQVVYYYKYGTIYRKFMIDYTLDVCGFLGHKEQGKNQNLVLQTVMNTMVAGKAGQIVHPCPFVGPHYMYNFTSVELLGQSMLPEGEYRVDKRYFSKKTNQTILFPRVYYTVKSKNPLLDMRLG